MVAAGKSAIVVYLQRLSYSVALNPATQAHTVPSILYEPLTNMKHIARLG
jgi:hypothetical protein